MSLNNMNYKYPPPFDPRDTDPSDPLFTETIIMIQNWDGDSVYITIANDPGNKLWTNDNPMLPGYVQWVRGGNTPEPSETAQEKLDRYREQVISKIMAEGERLRGFTIPTVEERLTARDKRDEAVLWYNDGSPPPAGFNPQEDAPYAWAHANYRVNTHTSLGFANPPKLADAAEDILWGWYHAYDYLLEAQERIDAVIEQSNQHFLPKALNMAHVDGIAQKAFEEFGVIETYIKNYTEPSRP